MHRRTFIASSMAVAGATATAGCNAGGATSLHIDEEQVDDDGEQKVLSYRANDTRQAQISIRQDWKLDSLMDRFGLRLTVTHRDGLSIDRLYFRLRAPPMSVKPPADIFLKTPDGGPWPPVDLNTVDNLWTEIEIDDIGQLGDGTLGLELLVVPGSVPVDEIAIYPEIDLSGGGTFSTDYLAEGSTRFEPVVDDE